VPEDCLFCKIVAGEIPAQEMASTETIYAFRDVDPQAPTHVLVIPRRHIPDFDSIEPGDGKLIADMAAIAQEIARNEELSPTWGGGGYRVVFNVGDDAGNSVPHLHLHVIGGRQLAWPPG